MEETNLGNFILNKLIYFFNLIKPWFFKLGGATVIGILLKYFLDHKNLKKDSDIKIFEKYNAVLPYEKYRYLVDDIHNNQYHISMNDSLDTYIKMRESVLNNYRDKDIDLKHDRFVRAMKEVLNFASSNFDFPPGGSRDIRNLQCGIDKNTKEYLEAHKKLEELNDEVCNSYDDYIQTCKEKLLNY